MGRLHPHHRLALEELSWEQGQAYWDRRPLEAVTAPSRLHHLLLLHRVLLECHSQDFLVTFDGFKMNCKWKSPCLLRNCSFSVLLVLTQTRTNSHAMKNERHRPLQLCGRCGLDDASKLIAEQKAGKGCLKCWEVKFVILVLGFDWRPHAVGRASRFYAVSDVWV